MDVLQWLLFIQRAVRRTLRYGGTVRFSRRAQSIAMMPPFQAVAGVVSKEKDNYLLSGTDSLDLGNWACQRWIIRGFEGERAPLSTQVHPLIVKIKSFVTQLVQVVP